MLGGPEAIYNENCSLEKSPKADSVYIEVWEL